MEASICVRHIYNTNGDQRSTIRLTSNILTFRYLSAMCNKLARRIYLSMYMCDRVIVCVCVFVSGGIRGEGVGRYKKFNTLKSK